MISCILATDMTYHFKHLLELRNHIQLFEIVEGKNIHRFIKDDEKNINANQQMILNNTIHISDISNPTKKSEVYDKWVDLVLIEFFNQGDLEKSKNLHISFMCDRYNTSKPKSQMGFIVKIVKPYFDVFYNMIPEIKPYIDNLNANFERYRILEIEEEKNNKK